MEALSPESRPIAPGSLGRLQEFLNSGHLNDRTTLSPADRDAIYARSTAGEPDAALARDFGLPQTFVAALRRGAPIFDDLRPLEGARAWLTERAFLTPGETLTEADLAPIAELRELLRELAAANNGHEMPAASRAALDAFARSVPLALTFPTDSAPALTPAAGGWRAVAARILATLFGGMNDGSWARLKRCPGAGCPFTFYDASRNRTGTWCSMAVCGNRTKVRSYQQRRRATRPVK